MSHVPTLLAACPFKYTQRLLVKEKKEMQVYSVGLGVCHWKYEALADNWDGHSVMRGLHYRYV